MTHNTKIMLEAIAQSGSDACRATAKDILVGNRTVENELKYCGSFMRCVYNGDFLAALDVADLENKNALKSIIK